MSPEQPVPGEEPEYLQQLFQQHQGALRMAVNRTGWRMTPEGGKAALDAGLVVESDPTWHFSDDHRACNGFALTELGRAVTEAQGWVCSCTGHALSAELHGVPITPATQGMCPGCRASAQAFGTRELPDGGGESCLMHLKSLEREEEKGRSR